MKKTISGNLLIKKEQKDVSNGENYYFKLSD